MHEDFAVPNERHEVESQWQALQELWDDRVALRNATRELRDSGGINALTVPQQRELIFRLAEQYDEQIVRREDSSMDGFMIDRALLPRQRFRDEPDIVDTYALCMKEIWRKYPFAARHLSDQLDQNAQVVDPDVYLQSLADIIRAPGLDSTAKHGAYAGLAYQASFGLLPYIAKRVHTLDTQPLATAMATLTLLEATAAYGEDWSFSEQSSREIQKLLHECAESDGSVLIRRKAEALTRKNEPNLFVGENLHLAELDHDRHVQTVLTPISQDHFGVYSRSGALLGLLPRNHAYSGVLTGILHPSDLDILATEDLTDTAEIERREEAQQGYAMFLDYQVLRSLEADYGFPITELTTREQLWFVASLGVYHKKEEDRVQMLTKKFGLDGARAFLSTEFGDHFRGTVLIIAEKFPEEDAKQIFKSFSEIVAFVQETADTLGQRFFAHDKAYNADAVRAELLSRAKDLLLTAEASDAGSIASKLARFKSDIVLFASMFKVTQKGQAVKFEDIKDVRLESLPSSELTDSDKVAMERILRENWSKQAPKLLESTLGSLQESFTNPRSRFFILRKGNDIAASLRFDEQDDGSLYAGSLNVNDIYRSAGIGEAMLQSTIDALAKDHIITAHVPANLPVATRYVNDFGLKIVGIEEEKLTDGTIARDLKLERNDAYNRQYGAHPHMERFDLTSGDAAIVAMVQYQASRGQVGTQFLSDPLNPHLRFIAFEPAVVNQTPTIPEERQAA